MKFAIDRFEQDIAIVVTDDGNTYNIPKALLPKEAKEGNVISAFVDRQETDEKKQEVKNLLNSLFNETE